MYKNQTSTERRFQPIDWRNELSDRAAKLNDEAVICDLCLPWTAENLHARSGVLEGYAAAGGTYTSLSCGFGNMAGFEGTMRHVAQERQRIRNNPEAIVQVGSVAEIRAAKRNGRLAASFNLQGADPLGGEISMVDVYYRLGVRQMLFCYNQRNMAGDGCHERTDSGLSRFGVELVREMNRVGMLIDCTHTGYRTTMEIMDLSEYPVIFSHSNPRALFDHGRNITDEQIKRSAETGGLVGVNGFGAFLSADGQDASPAKVARNIDHIVQLVGPQHAALGFDAVYTPEITYGRMMTMVTSYPDYPQPPWDFLLPHRVPELTQEFVDLGYSDEAILGILGENFLRVADAVWK